MSDNKNLLNKALQLSIIVPVTRKDSFARLLGSLEKFLGSENFDIELIAVCSKDFLKGVSSVKLRLKVVETMSLHTSVRRNLGVRQSAYAYLVFFDDDVVITEEWADTLLSVIGQQKDIMTGPSDHNTGSLRYRVSDVVYSSLISKSRLKDGDKPEFNKILTCNCIIKRRVWDHVGGFNEVADYHMDDTEFFYIAYKYGFISVYLNGLRVIHERRPFISAFINYISAYSFAAGKNTMFFPEVYLKIKGTKYLLLSYLLATVHFLWPPWIISTAVLVLYAVFIYVFLLKDVKNVKRLILYPAFLAVFFTVWISYLCGIFASLLYLDHMYSVQKEKRKRYNIREINDVL